MQTALPGTGTAPTRYVTARAMLASLQRFAAWCSSAADRHSRLIVVAFSVAFFWTVITRATIKPFWHDEIYTIVIAGLPSLKMIWKAQLDGLDTMPPFNSILTHVASSVFGVGPVSIRLPAMLGAWTLTLAAFAIVRQRSNAIAGLSAMLMTFVSGASNVAYEARGYGVMLGLFAVALYCWSEAASGRRRGLHLPVLAMALAAGMWTHYYAALAVIPIVAGEFVRLIRTRTLDWGVLGSLTGAGIASLPLYPLIKLASSQSATYFRHESLRDVPDHYMAIAGALVSPWALTLGAVIAATALLPPSTGEQGPRESPRIPAHEIACAITTLLIPLWANLVSSLVSGAFVPRYAMSTVVGFCLVGPILVARIRNGLAQPLFCLCLVLAFVYSFRDVRPKGAAFQSPTAYRPLLATALSKSTPVVVTGTLYLQMWYYAPPESRRWLSYVADPSAALRLIGTDTLERDYLVLRNWYPVNIQDYGAFVDAHPRFLVYSVEALNWLPARLAEDHAVLRELGQESGATLYEVTLR